MPTTKPYVAPDTGRIYQVDTGLDPTVLSRLNRLLWMDVHEVCAGHGSRILGTPGYVTFQAKTLRNLEPYIDRLSATPYAAHPFRTRTNGAPYSWKLRIECDRRGPAPRAWWTGLVNLLEDNPNCEEWLR